jgi:RNA polymerase sigma-70 factor, ECF subfamily
LVFRASIRGTTQEGADMNMHAAAIAFETTPFPSRRPTRQFELDLVALMPRLRKYAGRLCNGRPIAEDLAQDALAKAWRSQNSFEAGTNMKAWLFTILRNEVCSNGRRAWREVHWDSDKGESIAAPSGEQEWTMELSDTNRAMRSLPRNQRDALIVVAVGGYSYHDGAKFCGAPVGTVKSRVARARAGLAKALASDESLPRYSQRRAMGASADILAQLSALTQPVRRTIAKPAPHSASTPGDAVAAA